MNKNWAFFAASTSSCAGAAAPAWLSKKESIPKFKVEPAPDVTQACAKVERVGLNLSGAGDDAQYFVRQRQPRPNATAHPQFLSSSGVPGACRHDSYRGGLRIQVKHKNTGVMTITRQNNYGL